MFKAAFLTGLQNIEIGHLDQEKFDGLKLKVNSCALCGSDIRIFNTGNERITYPAIIGHEVSGTVVESFSKNFKAGDKVSIGADIPCGKCKSCKSNKPNLCKKNLAIGYQLQGGFSEYMLLSKDLINYGPIKKLPQDMSLEIGCLGEPLACAINGIEKLNIKGRGGKMIIFGAGPIGIMLGMLAKKYYHVDQVDYVELTEYKIEFLKKLEFVDKIYSPEFLESKLNNFKESYDFVITACSAISTHSLGISLLSNGGAINFFGGLPKPSSPIPIVTNDIHYRELTLTGSHGSTPIQHARAVNLISENSLFFEKLITHRYKLDDIQDAFSLASKGEGIKIIIKP